MLTSIIKLQVGDRENRPKHLRAYLIRNNMEKNPEDKKRYTPAVLHFYYL